LGPATSATHTEEYPLSSASCESFPSDPNSDETTEDAIRACWFAVTSGIRLYQNGIKRDFAAIARACASRADDCRGYGSANYKMSRRIPAEPPQTTIHLAGGADRLTYHRQEGLWQDARQLVANIVFSF
jgi:hypothetical protein